MNKDGNLTAVSLYLNTVTPSEDKMIINPYQAMHMLYNGDYTSINPSPITDESEISFVDLIYKPSVSDISNSIPQYDIVPVYCFYVEVENTYTNIDGLKSYGIYYVDAILQN